VPSGAPFEDLFCGRSIVSLSYFEETVVPRLPSGLERDRDGGAGEGSTGSYPHLLSRPEQSLTDLGAHVLEHAAKRRPESRSADDSDWPCD
jgi:hypothetical protein